MNLRAADDRNRSSTLLDHAQVAFITGALVQAHLAVSLLVSAVKFNEPLYVELLSNDSGTGAFRVAVRELGDPALAFGVARPAAALLTCVLFSGLTRLICGMTLIESHPLSIEEHSDSAAFVVPFLHLAASSDALSGWRLSEALTLSLLLQSYLCVQPTASRSSLTRTLLFRSSDSLAHDGSTFASAVLLDHSEHGKVNPASLQFVSPISVLAFFFGHSRTSTGTC